MQNAQADVFTLLVSRSAALDMSAPPDILERNRETVVEKIRTLIAPVLADRAGLTKFPLTSARQSIHLDDEARVIIIYLDDLLDKADGRDPGRGNFFEYPPGFKKVRRRINRLLQVEESWTISILIHESYFAC